MKKQGNVQLSKRLTMVAQMVTPGYIVADIGCDHGYISIYLIQNKIAAKVIAMDVNKGPLQKAQENVETYSLSEYIETRLSDGGKELIRGEVDSVVIAGMGGILMSRILKECDTVIDSCKELILQPQSEIHLVRRQIRTMGYQIVQEEMLMEEGKYYIAIKASKLSRTLCSREYSEFDDLYGSFLLEKRHPVFKEYLFKEYRAKENIIKELSQIATEKSKIRIEELSRDMEYIKEGLQYYEM